MSYFLLKRIFDIILSSLALLILSPIFLIVVLFLKFSGEGEIFYLQERVGTENNSFNIWKFATMVKNSVNMKNGDVTVANDPRVLPMGRILRITKINELPQLINILKGEMSIVGARPLMKRSFYLYGENVREIIYKTPPGLTGIGSVIFRNEEKLLDISIVDPLVFYERNIIPYKGELELWYQKNISFFTDFMLIFLTVWVIIFPESNLVYKVFKDLPERPLNLH